MGNPPNTLPPSTPPNQRGARTRLKIPPMKKDSFSLSEYFQNIHPKSWNQGDFLKWARLRQECPAELKDPKKKTNLIALWTQGLQTIVVEHCLPGETCLDLKCLRAQDILRAQNSLMKTVSPQRCILPVGLLLCNIRGSTCSVLYLFITGVLYVSDDVVTRRALCRCILPVSNGKVVWLGRVTLLPVYYTCRTARRLQCFLPVYSTCF